MNFCTVETLYTLFEKHPHITTDSRKIEAGSIFFALHGEQFDGNNYAAAALAQGAVAAVVDRAEVVPPEEETSLRYLLVEDTLQALQKLATHHRRTLGIPVLAITGSNGKTTTKELVGRTLSQKFRTAVTQGNLNNHIGVPLTLLSIPPETEFAVVEMGANHLHEIETLCAIAEPDFGLITNIGRAHLEGFGGPEGIRRGKGELFDYLAARNATAFYLQESETLCSMAAERPALHAIPYAIASLRALAETEFLEVQWGEISIRTHLVGDYNRSNIAAAIAVGTHFGVAPEAIAAAIERYRPDNNRSQKQQTPFNTLILDAYNANPSSMQAALENFAAASSNLPKVAILGDMRELGEYAASEHARIIELMHHEGLREAYLVGEHITLSGANTPGYHPFETVDELRRYLIEHPLRERFILIKGSRGIHLEKILDLL